ncbi:MAG: NfeD family protein, partial [Abditibacteriota bacterium]|nr:NfeD family protein [Abditibacteriota bacterium]
MTCLYWIIWGGVLVVTEMFVGSFVLLWFGLGAFAAALTCRLGFPEWAQWSVFAAVGIVLFVIFRRSPFLLGKPSDAAFGAERLVGMTGTVTRAVAKNSPGRIKVDGEVWTAVSDEDISENETVLVERIDGNKTVV